MKILIISHNPLTTYQNMGKTMMSLFRDFEPSELCQLYIYPTKPDTRMCSSYYNISDMDVARSFLRFGKVRHREYKSYEIDESSHDGFISQKDSRAYRKKRSYLRLLGRNVAWFFAKWFNGDLKKWIENEKPTHIFLATGDSMFIYWIAQKMSRKYHVPIVGYFCDDYYLNREYKGVIECLYKMILRRTIRNSISRMLQIVTICDSMTDKYGELFKVAATTIMTGSNYEVAKGYREPTKSSDILYMGGLGYDRDVAIVKFADTIKAMNEKYNSRMSVSVYTGSNADYIKNASQKNSALKYCGFLTGEKFRETMLSAKFLLHVESFNPINERKVKYSVSTKIADTLSSGTPLMAYGPSGIASIDHLKKNKCAYVMTEERPNIDSLYEFIKDKEKQEECVNRALATAERYHDSLANSKKLKKIFKDIDEDTPN